MILWLLAFGCGAKARGDLRIDGEPVRFSACANLASVGFDGVDLEITDGRVLRLFREGEALTEVGFFDDPRSDVGAWLGPCVDGFAEDSDVVANGVPLLRGEATLACADVFEITGSVAFERCR